MNDVELIRLEQRLERRLAVDPPPELRARVARSVARELRRSSIEWFSFAGLAAAAFALWADLSWTASRNTSFLEPAAASDTNVAAQIRELLPELSAAEARRQAVLLQGAAQFPDGNAARRAARLGVTR